MRIEGKIVGFDEFMNVVISEAEEVYTEKAKAPGKAGTRRDLGRILLKGDNIVSVEATMAEVPTQIPRK